MAGEFEVDPAALRGAAAQLDQHADEVASHGETLDAQTAGTVGRGVIGEVVESTVRRGLRIVAHDISRAVSRFYSDAAGVMRKAAAETERTDGQARSAFDDLAQGRPADSSILNERVARTGDRDEPAIHSRYSDSTPVYEGQQPGKIQGPDPLAGGRPHTRLQWDNVNGRPYKAREYGERDVPVRDIDFTTPTFPNGSQRPGHRAPEQHRWMANDPNNPAAGYKRGPGEPLVMP
jgi:hypothetical protein